MGVIILSKSDDISELSNLVHSLKKDISKVFNKKNINNDVLEQKIASIRNDLESITKRFDELEETVIRLEESDEYRDPKLEKLPEPNELKNSISSIKEKFSDKIDSVDRRSISRMELYGYAGIISFFTTILVTILTFIIGSGFDLFEIITSSGIIIPGILLWSMIVI